MTMPKKMKSEVVPADEVSSDRHGASSKYALAWLGGALLLALGLRIAAFLSLKQSIYFHYLLWDERIYHTGAEKIVKGVLNSTSFYANLMALVYALFSPDAVYVRVMNLVAGVLLCFLVYVIGKELANRSVGLLACFMAAAYEPFILYSVVPLKTSFTLLFFALAICLFLSLIRDHSMTKVFLLGVVGGLLLNLRANSVAVILLLALFVALHGYRRRLSVTFGGVVLLLYLVGLLAPTVLTKGINYLLPGEVASSTPQLGLNLYLGNSLDNPDPYYRPAPFAEPSPYVQGTQFTIEASEREGRRLSPEESSSYWTWEAMKIALRHPLLFSEKIFLKALALLNCFEPGDHYHAGFLSQFVGFFKLPLLRLWLILPLGLAGVAISSRMSRQAFALTAIALAYAATLLLFFINTRYRLPLLVVLIPFAAHGLVQLFDFMSRREAKKVGVYLVVAVSVAIIELLPIRGAGELSAYYNTHALVLSSKGRREEAVEYWKKSSQMKQPFSSYANFSLAKRSLRSKRPGEAIAYLEQIADDSFAGAGKFALLGDAFLEQRKQEEAMAAYRKSISINRGQLSVRRKLIRIYKRTDPQRAHEESEKFKYISAFYKKRSGFGRAKARG